MRLKTMACIAGSVIYFSFSSAQAQNLTDLNIITGPTSGTYEAFGQDIAKLLNTKCGAEIAVQQSEGSRAALEAVRGRSNVQLGIVQSDVLAYINAHDDNPVYQDWLRNVNTVLPLYPEEVHLVARKSAHIRSVADLASKRVSVDRRRSGTNITATQILEITKVNLTAPLQLSPAVALERVLLPEGDPNAIDAFFFVAGKPAKLLNRSDEAMKTLELVPINPLNGFDKTYRSAVVRQANYKWLEDDVETIAPLAVLVTFTTNRPQLEQTNCLRVGLIGRLIKENIDELRLRGHPKWNEVNLEGQIPGGWKKNDCVERQMTTRVKVTSSKRCYLDQKCVTLTDDAAKEACEAR